MIIPSTVNHPFIVSKQKEHLPEGRFVLHFYGHKIIHENRVMYKYYPLRFDGEIARFKSRKEAREYGSYRLGID